MRVRPRSLFQYDHDAHHGSQIKHPRPHASQCDAPPDVDFFVDARRRVITLSTEKGPEPPTTRAVRHARYSRLTSYPGGPNRGPALVTARSLMELNPYGRCTVNIATTSTPAIGTLAIHTKAPT